MVKFDGGVREREKGCLAALLYPWNSRMPASQDVAMVSSYIDRLGVHNVRLGAIQG
jgi:hypothetical protein